MTGRYGRSYTDDFSFTPRFSEVDRQAVSFLSRSKSSAENTSLKRGVNETAMRSPSSELI